MTIEVGQEIIIEGYGNYTKAAEVTTQVTRVGKKYFYADYKGSNTAFNLQPEKEGYFFDKDTRVGQGHTCLAWPSKKAQQDYYQREERMKYINSKVFYKIKTLTDDQLKRIEDILREDISDES